MLTACDKGELLDNQPPDTFISLSSIELSGTDRLNSEVTLHWSGTDEDGWVTGYEFSFDNVNWVYTPNQDSTFNFDISAGSDTVDINFWVRAIDNKGTADPSPDYLRIPIRNTPPSVAFDSTQAIPDTNLVVITAFWNVTDMDGNETVDSLYIKLNNGPWFPLDPSIRVLTLVPNDPTAAGPVGAAGYKGLNPVLLPGTLTGLVLDGDNRLYLKARDIAGTVSAPDSTDLFFVRRKTSDLLVIDANSSTVSPTPEEVYLPILTTVNGGYDYIDIISNNGAQLPQVLDPTFGFIMNLYDIIFWYGDETLVDGSLYLELAAGVIQKYFNQGGKMLISNKFPSPMDVTSLVFAFTPMDSLSSSAGQARIPVDSLVMPSGSFASNYDTLKSAAFITGADPFYLKANATEMFSAQIQPVSGWVGPRTVVARTAGAGGNTNQVFVSVELHKLTGNAAALTTFFNQVITNEFNW